MHTEDKRHILLSLNCIGISFSLLPLELPIYQCINLYNNVLSHDQCHGIKARTHACAEIRHSPTRCIIRKWKAHSFRMHPVGKCVVTTWAWVLAIKLYIHFLIHLCSDAIDETWIPSLTFTK